MRTTVKTFAEKHGVDVMVANSVLNFLEKKGQATVVELQKSPTGKGRAAKVYEMADSITIQL